MSIKKLNKIADDMANMDKEQQKKKAPKHQMQEDESLEGVNDTSKEEQQEGESDASENIKQKPKIAGKQVAAIKAKGKLVK